MLTCAITIGLQEVADAHRGIAQKQLKIQQDTVKQKLSDKQKQCLQLFRLTESTRDATYEWYKDRVEDRVEGTCSWFLKHDHFQKWLRQSSGPLLVSADPGCGKSVLAKYLIDHVLPQSATICYYFFKDEDQNTVRQALCALLHQLFSQKPSLIQHAMKQWDKDGLGLINSRESLWTVLGDAVQDPQAGSVIIVLDALDECAELELETLIGGVERQLRHNQLGHGKMKYLLTSRPYEQIVSNFCRLVNVFPYIRIPGEEKSEEISEEVNHVILCRVDRLAVERKLSAQVKNHLRNLLLTVQHRTYLWVYLVFEYLKTNDFKKTTKGVESTIQILPKNIDQAYEQILKKTKEHWMVRKALSIILAASRPLTIPEMRIAMEMDKTSQSMDSLDLEEKEEDFKSRLRSWCGLFVSIHHDKVYFLHQTAREFLLANPPSFTVRSTEHQWQHSITIHEAHMVLADLCVRYLSFLDSDAGVLTETSTETGHHSDSRTLLDYSARFWDLHFREAGIHDDDSGIVRLALRISEPSSKTYLVWSNIHWGIDYWRDDDNRRFSAGLMVASFFGHNAVVKLLLNTGADVNAQGGDYGNALQAASFKGNEQVVKLLLLNKGRRQRTLKP